MAEKEDFARMFAGFQATYGNELRAKVARLDDLIGRSHWLSVGTYKENLIRSILSNKLPREYEIGTGFVLAQVNGKKTLSRQIDLLVWNSHYHSPFFRDGDFVIIAPEALAGAIEVKSTLSTKELKKSLNNLDSLMAFKEFYRRDQVVHRSIFAFEKDDKLSFPKSVFNSLNRHYQKDKAFPLAERVRLTGDHDRWSLPWINNIAISDLGVINCDQWRVNTQPVVSYAAYSTLPKKDAINAYGFVERSILMDLMLGYRKAYARMNFPGFSTALFSNAATLLDKERFILFPDQGVTQVGNLTGDENTAWISGVYHPPVVKADEAEEEEGEEEEE